MKTKDGWEYFSKKNANGKLVFSVTPPENIAKPTPQKLFKYYPLNKRSIDALINSYLYAPHKGQLNDLFDCHPSLIDFSHPEVVREIASLRSRFAVDVPGTERNLTWAYDMAFHRFFGIISMTESFDNILMWAHYANNNGFVIELDTQKLLITDPRIVGPFQINYQAEISPFILGKDEGDGYTAFLYQSTIKHQIWQYESEWRFIAYDKESMKMPPPFGSTLASGKERKFASSNCVTKIILGGMFIDAEDFINKHDTQTILHFQDSNVASMKCSIIDFALTRSIPIFIVLSPRFPFNFTPKLPNFASSLEIRPLGFKKLDDNQYLLIES